MHYIIYAHVQPYRPQGPCARMKHALSHASLLEVGVLNNLITLTKV